MPLPAQPPPDPMAPRSPVGTGLFGALSGNDAMAMQRASPVQLPGRLRPQQTQLLQQQLAQAAASGRGMATAGPDLAQLLQQMPPDAFANLPRRTS